jgi:YggT family protein
MPRAAFQAGLDAAQVRSKSWNRGPFPSRAKPLFRPEGEVNAMPTNPFLWLVHELIWIYIYVLIAAAVFSWLVAFNVVNTRNPIVASIGNFLYHATEPVLSRIRPYMPNLGPIDISLMVAIIGLIFLDLLINWLYWQMFGPTPRTVLGALSLAVC